MELRSDPGPSSLHESNIDRVHSDQGKSGNQGIIREFTKWVFFLKKSGNYQGI